MKTASVATVIAALCQGVTAHYRFPNLQVSGKSTGDYVNVRQNTNYNSPVTDVTSKDLVCNVGGLASGTNTSVLTVAPGDTIAFGTDQAIYHPGPANVWLSMAPGNVTEYDGSGDWAKIAELGATFPPGQIDFTSDGMTSIPFTIPTCVSPGQYLVRVEQIGLHVASSKGGAQFYISCGQLQVTGSGSGTLSPTVKFPGAYTGTEPGLLINIYNPVPTNYTIPGGAVATC